MKKKVLASVMGLLSVMLFTTGCNADQDTTGYGQETQASATAASTTASSAEATSGASENGDEYADLSELADKYDVIIVGAGGAGMTAAIEAKDAGMNPVIFEKLPVAGGNTVKASAGMNASESKFEAEQGVEDSNDLFFEETLKGGGGTNDQELLRYFVDHSADAIDWLDQNGIVLDNLTTTGGMSVTRTHRPSDGSAVGEYLVNGLLRNIGEREIPIFVNADVTAISQNDGTVDGVTVVFNQDEEKEIAADAVIVTTGGFGANQEMIQEYRPDLEGYVSTNSEGSTGDGITMITELGGATVDLDQIQIHPTVQQKDGYLITEAVRGEGAILVNQAGDRFFNELETRDKVSQAIIDLPEQSAYLIFDDSLRDRVKAIDFYDQQGFVETGQTIAELAEKIDVPADELQKTLDTWNQSVASQSDPEFNRTTGMTEALATAPYYAIKIAPGIHHTMGGVKINTETQVLKEDGDAITGLYAAGEVTGGLHGQNRIGGNAVADIVIFGRQAGIQSAAYVAGLE
ncbi:flavocytochrome c [Enterococcus sp. LJL120]